ncbi:hypothetical protein D3C72_2351760 [compost metagenome]
MFIGLSVNLGQLERDEIAAFQSFSVKEKRRWIKHSKNMFVSHDWRQLIKVADKQHLNAAKFLLIPTNVSQRKIHHIQNICTQHRGFINNDDFDFAEEF